MTDAFEPAFADGAAFLPYLAAGDPGPSEGEPTIGEGMAATRSYVEALVAGGADVIELGLPFSEPIADGPTVREATVRALDAGMTVERFLELVDGLAVDVPIVVMTYYNPIVQYGDGDDVTSFVDAAQRAGIDGIIVPDLPVEESDPLCAACADAGVAPIFIAAPTTRDDRLDRILSAGAGYLYVQARLGTTGVRSTVSDRTAETLARIRKFEDRGNIDPIPKAVGFGVSSGDQAREIVSAGADGVIVGSALVDLLDGDDIAGTADALRSLGRDIKDGARAGRSQ